MQDATPLIELIRSATIGEGEAVPGPFGPRRVTYADYTASGRSVGFLEDYIRDAVLPLYANTHTESSGTGLQTTRFREEARAIIREAVGGTRERHAVVFCGSGSTGAVDRMIGVLNLRIPHDLDRRHGLSAHIPGTDRPVVFIGPYEHHSNEIPWRESIADVVVIRESLDGGIDLEHLEEELQRHADRRLRIGSFSAASNVTGIITDTRAVSILLHRHGALSFWDYAAAAPYVRVAMGPSGESGDDALDYRDAIFLSPHKLIGGPGTPGVLVARRELFTNTVPCVPGGGTVSYVNPEEHRYVTDIEHREEGGTPAIVESIRAGLVFQLKRAVGEGAIEEREESFIRRAIASWKENPNIVILGNSEARRLSIVSFVIRCGGGYLHHNYVVALLNDLFGIQARGGCSCAGPYGHRLLGIDLERSHEFERLIGLGFEGIKPGWVRVNFNYFISEPVFRFVLDAVHFIADQGHRLLNRYRFEPRTALWKHVARPAEPAMSLHDIRYGAGGMKYARRRRHEPEDRLAEYLEEAGRIVAEPFPEADTVQHLELEAEFEHLRWFPLPDRALAAGFREKPDDTPPSGSGTA